MQTILRTWLSLAAIGAGLIHLSIGAGDPFSPLFLFVMVGAAELVWAATTLARGYAVVPRIALGGTLSPILIWAVIISVGGGSTVPFFPMAGATLFNLLLAIALAVVVRRNNALAETTAPKAGRFLIALAIGAAAVAGITTPALAGTPVGQLGNPAHEHSGTAVELEETGHDH